MSDKRFVTVTIKTDPGTAAELEELRHFYFPPKTLSAIGHIALRHGCKVIRRIKQEAMEIEYTPRP